MKLFADTCDILSKESGSIKKIEIISDAIKQIQNDQELNLFCLYLTGLIYPASIQKTINVGKALIRDAICKLTGITNVKWEENYKKFGEIGEAIEYILQNHNSIPSCLLENSLEYKPNENFSLIKLSQYIEKLSETSGSLAKVDILAELFSQLSPLQAKFATKILLQNLRIGVKEATVESALSKTFEVDKKQIAKLNFYIGDIGEVAIRCKEKNFENIEFKLFHPIKAMLASAEVEVDEIFKRMGSKVWTEYKYDGIRAHIHKKGDKVEIFTRDLKRITDQFPEVVEFFKKVPINTEKTPQEISFLLDGEIVPFSGGKIHPFAYIQKRLGRKENIENEVENNPAIFVAYDILYLNGELLFDNNLEYRRNILEKTFEGVGLMFSTRKIVGTENEFLDFFRESKNEGREGLMVKNAESKYEPGKRGINWLKYKQTLDPLDVVIMIAEYGEGKNAKYLSSYTFGVWDEKKENIIPIGRVASGATEEDLKYFTEYLPTITKEKIPNGYVVLPEVILEVGFENIQKSERYSSGYAVRFPRILRNRTGDKPLDEISTIDDVKKIYKTIEGITTK